MGSAIGDYIHLTTQGYLNHGTYHFHSSDSDFSSASSIFSNAHNMVDKGEQVLTAGEETQLANAIESLMQSGDSSDAVQQKAVNQIWEALTQQLQEEFGSDVVSRIERETGNILKYPGIKISRMSPVKKGTFLSTVQKRIAVINASLGQLNKETYEYQELMHDLETIYDEVRYLIKDGESCANHSGYHFDLQKILDIPNGNEIRLSKPSSDKIINTINKIAAGVAPVENVAKGSLFERLIAAAPLIGVKMAITKIQDAIASALVGNNISKVIFKKSDFVKNIDIGAVTGYNQDKINNNLYLSTNASQDKVDTIITLNNKPIAISAKNVNLKSGIRIVHDSPLSALINQLDGNFINHFLNATAQHYKPAKKGFKKDNSLSKSLISQAHQAIQPLLLAQALRGHKDAQKAEVFIVNDNRKGKVRVFDIATLIDKITSNNAPGLKTKIMANGSDIKNIRFTNPPAKKVSGYLKRIEAVLSEVHSQKISVTISGKI